MRTIAALFTFTLAFNCWNVGAWAQPAVDNVAAPRVEGAVNVWGFNSNYRQTHDNGSAAALTNDSKIRPGSGAVVESTARPLPESVRMSAKNLTVDVASRMASVQQDKTPGHINASAYGAENTLSNKEDLYRR